MEAFLGEPADHRHVDYFLSLEKFHQQGLPCKLPARLEEALKSDSRLVELKSEAQTLTQKTARISHWPKRRANLAATREP